MVRIWSGRIAVGFAQAEERRGSVDSTERNGEVDGHDEMESLLIPVHARDSLPYLYMDELPKLMRRQAPDQEHSERTTCESCKCFHVHALTRPVEPRQVVAPCRESRTCSHSRSGNDSSVDDAPAVITAGSLARIKDVPGMLNENSYYI